MAKKSTPDQIFTAALAVFARYGLRRTRMEDIARELDLATATLYRYVKDKLDLYEKTVAFGIRRWQAKVFEAVSAETDVTRQFVTMARKGYEYLAGDEDLRRILINDPAIFPLSPRKVRFPDIDKASIALIRQILQHGIDTGVFRPVDVALVSDLLYSVYVMFIIKAYIKSEEDSDRRMFEEGLDLIVRGLLASAPKGGSRPPSDRQSNRRPPQGRSASPSETEP
ncbi:MAG: TetR/AcrR family transcriptional regulator [Thermodesulfobacteriota bacterium]